MTTPHQLLTQHIGHRAVLREPRPGKTLELKCVDCNRVIDLSSILGLRPGSSRSTSTSTPTTQHQTTPLAIGDPNACVAHPGQHREACSNCRSEAIALATGETRTSDIRTGTPGWERDDWQATKAEMAARRTQARQQRTTSGSQPDALGVGVAQDRGVAEGSAAAGMQAAADAGGAP